MLRSCWEALADRTLSVEAQTRLGLPSQKGGSGVQFAATRTNAAYWSSWSKCFEEVLGDTSYTTAADLLDATPRLAATLEATRAGLATQGQTLSEGAALADALRQHYPQKLLTSQVQKKLYAGLLATLNRDGAAETRGCGGPGAAGFLSYPSEPCCSMEDPLFCTALRQRLFLPRAEYAQAQLNSVTQQCHLPKAHGAPCGQQLDERGYHALTEKSGGGVLLRHTRLQKAVGGLVVRWRGTRPLHEQRVPTWDRPSRRRSEQGRTEQAVLDVEYIDDDGRRWIDVTVRHPCAGDENTVRLAARKDGEASRRAEREKHERYPGPRLTPFAVETPGRLGAEARLWLLTRCGPCQRSSSPRSSCVLTRWSAALCRPRQRAS